MTLILMCCRKTGTIFWNLIWAKKADMQRWCTPLGDECASWWGSKADGTLQQSTKNALHMFWSCHRQTFHEVNKASGHVSQYFGETEQGLRWQTLKDESDVPEISCWMDVRILKFDTRLFKPTQTGTKTWVNKDTRIQRNRFLYACMEKCA